GGASCFVRTHRRRFGSSGAPSLGGFWLASQTMTLLVSSPSWSREGRGTAIGPTIAPSQFKGRRLLAVCANSPWTLAFFPACRADPSPLAARDSAKRKRSTDAECWPRQADRVLPAGFPNVGCGYRPL